MNDTIFRTTTLPDQAEIIKRMRTVLDEDSLIHSLYRPYAIQNAGKELNSIGINMTFGIAIDVLIGQHSPVFIRLVQMTIPQWIDALIDDKEIAEAAKEILRDFEAQSQSND